MALLDNPAVAKVFHAARQDIEIFYHLSGRTPRNVFDTQIAGMVCGLGEFISYETLTARRPATPSTNPRASPTGAAARSATSTLSTRWAT